MENDVLTPYLFLIFPDLSDYKANSTLHPDFTLIIFAQAYALCFLLAALFSTIHAFFKQVHYLILYSSFQAAYGAG